YERRLAELRLSAPHVRRVGAEFTAQAFITTDIDDNQITAFHPGAMSHSHLNAIGDVDGATLAIVSPDGRQGMIEHARDLAAAGRVEGVPAVKPAGIVDPTGCGDAYRAGLLYGMARRWSWRKSARLASVMGSIKIAYRGGQNHSPARDEIAERFAASFGETL